MQINSVANNLEKASKTERNLEIVVAVLFITAIIAGLVLFVASSEFSPFTESSSASSESFMTSLGEDFNSNMLLNNGESLVTELNFSEHDIERMNFTISSPNMTEINILDCDVLINNLNFPSDCEFQLIDDNIATGSININLPEVNYDQIVNLDLNYETYYLGCDNDNFQHQLTIEYVDKYENVQNRSFNTDTILCEPDVYMDNAFITFGNQQSDSTKNLYLEFVQQNSNNDKVIIDFVNATIDPKVVTCIYRTSATELDVCNTYFDKINNQLVLDTPGVQTILDLKLVLEISRDACNALNYIELMSGNTANTIFIDKLSVDCSL